MTDRELLEMAALAAGYSVKAYDYDDYDNIYGLLHGERWNPITDDGDALRLAVKLDLEVRWHSVLNQALANAPLKPEAQENGEDHNGDRYAATRRAIVRAAAAIGAGLAPFPTAEQIREDWT